jgi:cbb3-type cytochrome oxidase maturation protein
MEILYLLIPLALVLIAFAIGALLWAIRSGQYDDMEGPAYRILLDDDEAPHKNEAPREEGPSS